MSTRVNGQSDLVYDELKKKRTVDRTAWKAKWVKKRVDEMVKSLVSIFHGV